MQHNFTVHNVNSACVIATWLAHAANLNDAMPGMCNMCTQASQTSYIILTCHDLLIGLACMHADYWLLKITASHFWELITHYANGNMPMMVLIA